jgi:hypothetical protein
MASKKITKQDAIDWAMQGADVPSVLAWSPIPDVSMPNGMSRIHNLRKRKRHQKFLGKSKAELYSEKFCEEMERDNILFDIFHKRASTIEIKLSSLINELHYELDNNVRNIPWLTLKTGFKILNWIIIPFALLFIILSFIFQ